MKIKMFSLVVEMLVLLNNNKEFNFGDINRGYWGRNVIVYFKCLGKVRIKEEDSRIICINVMVDIVKNLYFLVFIKGNYYI